MFCLKNRATDVLWRSQRVTQENPPTLVNLCHFLLARPNDKNPIPTSCKTLTIRSFSLQHSKHDSSHVHTDGTPASCEHQRFKRQSSVPSFPRPYHRWCWAHPEILSRSKMAQAKHRGAESNKSIQLMTAAHVKKAEKLGTSFTCKHGMKQKATSGSNKKQWLISKNTWTTQLEH